MTETREPLAGRRVVLIGASAGIGLETARLAAERGAEVVAVGRSMERLVAATGDIPGVVSRYECDASDQAELARLFALQQPFDYLATFVPAARDAAMAARFGRFVDMETETIEAIFRSRFWAHCHAARHGAPHIRAGGAIVFVSSTLPRKAFPGYAVSAAAGGALEALARVLAIELAPVRVNVVAPGFIASRGTSEIPPARKAQWDQMVATQPVKRLGTSREVADAVLFLMRHAFVTGALLSVDGGYTLT